MPLEDMDSIFKKGTRNADLLLRSDVDDNIDGEEHYREDNDFASDSYSVGEEHSRLLG